MKDPYRITETPAGTAAGTADGAPRGILRPVVWLALILSAAANVVASSIAGNPVLGSAFGLIALICATTLIVHHYRHRAGR